MHLRTHGCTLRSSRSVFTLLRSLLPSPFCPFLAPAATTARQAKEGRSDSASARRSSDRRGAAGNRGSGCERAVHKVCAWSNAAMQRGGGGQEIERALGSSGGKPLSILCEGACRRCSQYGCKGRIAYRWLSASSDSDVFEQHTAGWRRQE